ncbi:hypothetical protein ACL02P_14095 [Paenibacillus sp. MB22_1]|uniref:hypothetical protein n=1 Tax=Paenibacillus sp. MB22_1 TaxID=3383121 RepID=UPI0039A13018
MKEAAGGVPPASLDYGDIRGEEALRKEFAAYLYRIRGMRCQPVQIMIVSGSSEGFALIAQTLRIVLTSCTWRIRRLSSRCIFFAEPAIGSRRWL